MPVVTLTELTLRNLKPPDKGYVIYADRTLSGFGVRVTGSGHASYVLTYGPKRKRITIGDVGVVKLGQAREKAKTFLSEFQLHGEKPKALTWGEAKKLYEELHLDQHNRESSAKETKRLLKRFDRLKDTRLSEIGSGQVMGIVDKLLDTPSSANHHSDDNLSDNQDEKGSTANIDRTKAIRSVSSTGQLGCRYRSDWLSLNNPARRSE